MELFLAVLALVKTTLRDFSFPARLTPTIPLHPLGNAAALPLQVARGATLGVKVRNRLILELMARGGMRVGEVLMKLTPRDVNDQKFVIQSPESGKGAEVVIIPRKAADRLRSYMKGKEVKPEQRISRALMLKQGTSSKMPGLN